jgi:hypothetical protein
MVAPHVEKLEIEERALGSMFLASGTYVRNQDAMTGRRTL